jgi:hypothetical protein
MISSRPLGAAAVVRAKRIAGPAVTVQVRWELGVHDPRFPVLTMIVARIRS